MVFIMERSTAAASQNMSEASRLSTEGRQAGEGCSRARVKAASLGCAWGKGEGSGRAREAEGGERHYKYNIRRAGRIVPLAVRPP